MARGTNLDHTRQYNRRAVLAALRRSGVASRTEIAASTGLSLTAVSSLVEELVRGGWVASRGRRSTARGQPPIDFSLAEGGAFGLGVAFDRDHAVAALVDLSGRLLGETRVDLEDPTPEEAAVRAQELTSRLAETLPPAERGRILGLGVALPGVVDAKGRVERMVRLPHWEEVDVADLFARTCGLEVTVTNDAVAAAVGATSFGGEATEGTVCHVLFALGLGSALLFDGRPHRGLWGLSGRFGHIPVETDGLACPSCGGRGCLSLYASLEALYERVRATPGGDDLSERFAAGDPVVHDWIEVAAGAFARAMLVLENLLSPDVVILDGRIPESVLTALVERSVERYATLRPRRPDRPTMRLRVGSKGEAAAAFGAATVPIHQATAADLALVR